MPDESRTSLPAITGSPESDADWFVLVRNQETGPFTVDEMKAKAIAGILRPDSFVRKGQSGWGYAQDYPVLVAMMAAKSPAPDQKAMETVIPSTQPPETHPSAPAPLAPGATAPPKESLTQKVISIIASFLLIFYWFSCMCGAFPYFSWQYVQKHSFGSWLFFGEFGPAGQALIWPYYAVNSLLEKGWTQEEKENLAHASRSAIAMRKAMIFIDGFAKTGKAAPPADAARVRELLQEALDECNLVRDDVLAKIHPDYPKMYREKYVGALTRMVQMLDAARDDTRDNAQEIDTVERLLNEWDDWLIAHRRELRTPKDVPE